MTAIYFKTSDAAGAWIEEQRSLTGLSRAAIVNAVLEKAAREGWKIIPGKAVAIEKTAPELQP